MYPLVSISERDVPYRVVRTEQCLTYIYGNIVTTAPAHRAPYIAEPGAASRRCLYTQSPVLHARSQCILVCLGNDGGRILVCFGNDARCLLTDAPVDESNRMEKLNDD